MTLPEGTPPPDPRLVREAAREALGYDRLRAGQEEAVRSVLAGHDTLAVLPTGAGKSAIYQIAATLIPGPTVVVSPLIALQRDQVEALAVEAGVGRAVAVNSTVPEAEQRAAFADLSSGAAEFLFLAPERFRDPAVLDRLRDARLSLFVVDEAHCISDWGHDFRPAYLRLGAVVEALGRPPVLALTATAGPAVREEIVERLRMRDARIVARGFDRPNIWLEVRPASDDGARDRDLLGWVASAVAAGARPGIVYAPTRARTTELAAALADRGVRSAAYHAGLRKAERETAQAAFMADDLDVVVATTAFGLGIDKPDVRFVVHAAAPDSLDAYYQELGRAGRDRRPARAVLWFRPEDLALRRFQAASGRVDAEALTRVVGLVRGRRGPFPADELRRAARLSRARLSTALARLEEAGAVEVGPDGAAVATDGRPLEGEQTVARATGTPETGAVPSAAELADEGARADERRRRHERSRLEVLRGYAETADCRRRYLLAYLGEELDQPCGNCDTCDAGSAAAVEAASPAERPFAAEERVVHPVFGEGRVVRYEEGRVQVRFDAVGYKTLDLDQALADGLLQPLD